jgi:hypothetical protein
MMQVLIPARLFALPEHRTFKESTDRATGEIRPASSAWVTQFILGADAVKVYTDDDPTAGLNGSRAKLEGGEMIDVHAVCEVYGRSKSGIGIAVRSFQEIAKK